MKSIALLGFALAMSPVLAAAQQSPPPDAEGARPPRPSFAAMEQMHVRLEQLHTQERSQLLSSLTPAHRALLAGVIGQLAIAPTPDRAAGARTLDNSLSQSESRAVLSVETAMHAQMKTLMEGFRTQFEASLTPDQRAEMQQHMAERSAQHPRMEHPQRTTDPGTILLDVIGHTGGERHAFGPGELPPPGR